MYPKLTLATAIMLSVIYLSCKTETKNQLIAKVAKIDSLGVHLSSGEKEAIAGVNSPDAAVYIMVRHAEKEKGEDPTLTSEGKSRAARLLEIIKDFPITKICYTGNMKRTYETAQPCISHFNCGTETFSKNAVLPFFLNSLEAYRGKYVLVIANSNTLPMMLNALGNVPKFEDINEKEFDNIFVVTARGKDDALIKQYKF